MGIYLFLFYTLVFFIGLSFGSFINVIIARLDRKRGLIFGRSECPKCGHRLNWTDLAPVFSFIFLGGKCRYCHRRISLEYPAVEITTALVFLAYFFFNNPHGVTATIINPTILVVFISLIVFDIKWLILPDKMILLLILSGFLANFSAGLSGFLLSIVYGFILSVPFVILYLASCGRWLGFGDLKLIFVLGIIFGFWPAVSLIIVAVWAAALWGITLMTLGRATPKTALPFGAFLSSAAIVFIIFKSNVEIFIQQIFL